MDVAPSSTETAEMLWRRWHESRDQRARDRLILSHAPIVKYLAARKARHLPPHCSVEDLVSCGLLALIAALDRYDPAKGATFAQYAWARVSGSMIDELRRQDWAPRSLRQAGREVERTRSEWQTTHGDAPTDQELSRQLGITSAKLRDQLDRLALVELASLNAPTPGDDGEGLAEIGDTLTTTPGDRDPEYAALANERRSILKDAITSLSPREQGILTLLYVDQLQGAQAAQVMGISQSRVSQLLNGIRQKLKQRLDSYDQEVAPDARAA